MHHYKFRSALSFNRDLRWNTQGASDMATMFMEASSFNGDLSSFSTSGVTSMDTMFYYASSFEGKGLESWDTSSVVVFDRMFAGAIAFRGDGLSNWNVENAQFMDKMVRKKRLYQKHSSFIPCSSPEQSSFLRIFVNGENRYLHR
jgi:Mycoplasma protein of unknown function, DUF285